jgi:hypothetical protein
MTPATLVKVLTGVWLILFVGAFVAFRLTEPTGDSFTRGLNRMGVFFAWQGLAAIVAIVGAVAARGVDRTARPWLRRLGFAPLVATGGAFLCVVTGAVLAVVLADR